MDSREIAEIAFWLIAPDGTPKERYQARIDEIAAHIRAYGDERASEVGAVYEQSAAFKIGSAIINAKGEQAVGSMVGSSPRDDGKTLPNVA